MKVVLTAAVALVLVAGSAPALADTSTSTFEPPAYHLGSVNGQNGWKVGPSYDQEVVANSGSAPAFGQQSWRLSNAFTSGDFVSQPYSPPVAAPAGENEVNNVFSGQFSFLSATPNQQQPGLALSVSPDDGTGARMAYVRLEDTPSGIRVFALDTPNHYGAEFDERWIATLDRSAPHTINFAVKLVKGEANDIVRISIDGTEKDCGTSWENFYRYVEKDAAKAPDYVRPIDRMQFRAGGTAVPANAGKGFLFDNVTSMTTNTGGPAACVTSGVGPAGPPGPAGPAGPAAPAGSAQSRTMGRLVGNTLRTLHVPRHKHERFLSARARMRNKRLPVHGRRITVDLRKGTVGNYNVYITAKYRTRSGKVKTTRSMRALSVTRALEDTQVQ